MKAIIEYKNGSLSVGEVKFGDYDKESHEVSLNIVSDKMLNINAEELLKVVVDGTVIYDDRKHGKNTQTSQSEEDVVESSKEGKLFKVINNIGCHGFKVGEIIKYIGDDLFMDNEENEWYLGLNEVEEITLDGELYQYVGDDWESIKYGDVIKYIQSDVEVGYNIYFNGKQMIRLLDNDVRKIEFK